jgi:hypothetical protein
MTEIAGAARPTPLRGRRMLAMLRSVRFSARSPLQTAAADAPTTPHNASVGRRLARLGPGWQVLDDVPWSDYPVDHLVVGPGGVFAVTACYDARSVICLGSESLLVDDQRVSHGRDSRQAAADISARLSDRVGCPVPVTALVLIVGDRRFVTPDQPADAAVRVVTPAGAARWLRRRPVAWTDFGVERIYAAACDRSTWTAAATDPAPDSVAALGSGSEPGDVRAAQ